MKIDVVLWTLFRHLYNITGYIMFIVIFLFHKLRMFIYEYGQVKDILSTQERILYKNKWYTENITLNELSDYIDKFELMIVTTSTFFNIIILKSIFT